MQVNDAAEPSKSKSPTILDQEKARTPGTWGEPKYCERCEDLLPTHYTLRFCPLCRNETLNKFVEKPKSPEW